MISANEPGRIVNPRKSTYKFNRCQGHGIHVRTLGRIVEVPARRRSFEAITEFSLEKLSVVLAFADTLAAIDTRLPRTIINYTGQDTDQLLEQIRLATNMAELSRARECLRSYIECISTTSRTRPTSALVNKN